MSYIDIEKAECNYRVILGRHDRVTQTNQIADDCTAILLEFSYSDWGDAHEMLFFAGYEEGLQYSELFALAKQRNLPVVAAESPTIDPSRVNDPFLKLLDDAVDFRYRLGLIKNPLRLIELYASIRLATLDQPVDKGGFKYILAHNFGSWLENYPSRTGAMLEPRNLLMAQRATAFAYYQLENDIKRPSIALVVGAAHLGVEEALVMNDQERLSRLAKIPGLHAYFDVEEMGKIHFISNKFHEEDAFEFASGQKEVFPAGFDDELREIEDEGLNQIANDLKLQGR